MLVGYANGDVCAVNSVSGATILMLSDHRGSPITDMDTAKTGGECALIGGGDVGQSCAVVAHASCALWLCFSSSIVVCVACGK